MNVVSFMLPDDDLSGQPGPHQYCRRVHLQHPGIGCAPAATVERFLDPTTGDLTFDSASTLDQIIGRASADRLRVNGSLTLGGAMLNLVLGAPNNGLHTLIENDGADI